MSPGPPTVRERAGNLLFSGGWEDEVKGKDYNTCVNRGDRIAIGKG